MLGRKLLLSDSNWQNSLISALGRTSRSDIGCYNFAMHAGTWYAGVEGDDHNDCTYTITINKFDCPLNCSGRGTCIHKDNGTRTCQCDKVWSFTSSFLQKKQCLLHHGNLPDHVGEAIHTEQANDCSVICNSTFDTAEGGFCWQTCVSTHIQSADATRL